MQGQTTTVRLERVLRHDGTSVSAEPPRRIALRSAIYPAEGLGTDLVFVRCRQINKAMSGTLDGNDSDIIGLFPAETAAPPTITSWGLLGPYADLLETDTSRSFSSTTAWTELDFVGVTGISVSAGDWLDINAHIGADYMFYGDIGDEVRIVVEIDGVRQDNDLIASVTGGDNAQETAYVGFYAPILCALDGTARVFIETRPTATLSRTYLAGQCGILVRRHVVNNSDPPAGGKKWANLPAKPEYRTLPSGEVEELELSLVDIGGAPVNATGVVLVIEILET